MVKWTKSTRNRKENKMDEHKKWIDFKGNLNAQESKALILVPLLKTNITNRTMAVQENKVGNFYLFYF